MLLQGVRYYGEDFRFHYGDIRAEDGRFAAVEARGGAPEGCDTVIPGMVDIHLHGNSGVDFSFADYEGMKRIARYLARAGTTSFSAASMTLPEETLERAYRNAARLAKEAPGDCAALRGITMEGPFFSAAKKGAQAAEHLRLPDIAMLNRLQDAAEGLVRIVCVAPELQGAAGFIRAAAERGYVISAAHTNANYDEASAGFAAGARHVTHLFNAMPPLLHREPGVIGAAAECPDVTAELIGDGVHVHPSAVRAAFALFGPKRLCLISDALPATGLPEGSVSSLGGQRVTVSGGRATLDDGTIAGSVTSVFDCVRRVIGMGIPAEDALRCATANPARVLGVHDIGVIAAGRRADCIVCGPDWELKEVYIGGRAMERTTI